MTTGPIFVRVLACRVAPSCAGVGVEVVAPGVTAGVVLSRLASCSMSLV